MVGKRRLGAYSFMPCRFKNASRSAGGRASNFAFADRCQSVAIARPSG